MDWTPYIRKDGKLNIRKIKILLGDLNYIKLQQIFHWTTSVSELYYCYKNNIMEQPKCYCGYHLKFFVNKRRYNTYCSKKCSSNSIVRKEKFRNSCLEKYGADNPFRSVILKKKMIQTTLEKYGVDNISQKHLNKEILEKLNDKEWLIEQHHTLKKSIRQIAKELKINDSSLGVRFKKHNIKIIKHHNERIKKFQNTLLKNMV